MKEKIKEDKVFEKAIDVLKEMRKNKEIDEQQYNDMLMDIQLRRKGRIKKVL